MFFTSDPESATKNGFPNRMINNVIGIINIELAIGSLALNSSRPITVRPC